MAHHGGGPETLPRAHRARAPAMSAAAATPPPPTVAPLAPLPRAPPQPLVTLQTPRPESDRKGNEYVDNPLPFAPPPQQQQQQQRHRHQPHSGRHLLHLPLHPVADARRPPPPPVPAISKQPTAAGAQSASLAKGASQRQQQQQHELEREQHRLHHHHHHDQQQQPSVCASRRSIMCDECGRCRCFDCQQPPRLPVCWLCNNHCLCSADAAVDYASCLCCVKGVYYHCSDSDGGDSTCADDPCGCGPERRAARWGCLAVLSVVLPCLWLYWPLQGCKGAVENCYSRYSKQGCRCRPPLNTPEKRLLDSSPDF